MILPARCGLPGRRILSSPLNTFGGAGVVEIPDAKLLRLFVRMV
jgi:hypothetical protein